MVADKEAAKQKFIEFLDGKNLRMTSQRQAIIDTVFGTEEHFTRNSCWNGLGKGQFRFPRHGLSHLPLVAESGLVQELNLGKDYKYYDPNYTDHPHHNHIICQDCEKIVEFEDEKLEQLEEEISKQLGFSLRTQKLSDLGQLRQVEAARCLQEQGRLFLSRRSSGICEKFRP